MSMSRQDAGGPEEHESQKTLELLQLVDEARDDAQPLVPERRIGGIEAERRQQLLVALHAARLQHFQVLGLEVGLAGLLGGLAFTFSLGLIA